MTPITLHLIRHAPVVGQAGVIYGDGAEVDLVGQGERIAGLALDLPGPDVALWHHSGVDRAERTAWAVLGAMGAQGAALRAHGGFREQDFGALLGRRHEDVAAHLQFVDGKIYAPHPPEGESIENFIARVGEAVRDVAAAARSAGFSQAVVFCHGGTIRAAHAAVHGLDVQDFITLDTPPLFVYACDVTLD
jgi:broad specificity phosphatase PhoE